MLCTSVYIPEKELLDLKKMAAENNRSISNMVVQLIKEAVKGQEKIQEANK